jgi:hypothetical protein
MKTKHNDEVWDVDLESLLTPGVDCVEYTCKCGAKHRVKTRYPAFIQAQFKDYVYTCDKCKVKVTGNLVMERIY